MVQSKIKDEASRFYFILCGGEQNSALTFLYPWVKKKERERESAEERGKVEDYKPHEKYIPLDVPSYLHSFLRPPHYLSLPFSCSTFCLPSLITKFTKNSLLNSWVNFLIKLPTLSYIWIELLSLDFVIIVHEQRRTLIWV